MYFLLILGGRKGRGETKSNVREEHQSAAISMRPIWEQNPQHRHVPQWGIEPATLWFTDTPLQGTPARAESVYFKEVSKFSKLCPKYNSCRVGSEATKKEADGLLVPIVAGEAKPV